MREDKRDIRRSTEYQYTLLSLGDLQINTWAAVGLVPGNPGPVTQGPVGRWLQVVIGARQWG